jgi:hypothetical protein
MPTLNKHTRRYQGGHTMRAHTHYFDTMNTFSTDILNKNESCKAIRINLNLISFMNLDSFNE